MNHRPHFPAGIAAGMAAAILLTIAAARADFYEHFGASPRAAALGGALTAASEGETAPHYNPGALAFLPRARMMFGYHAVRYDLGLRTGNRASDQKALGAVDNFTALSLGFARPIRFGSTPRDDERFECPSCGTTVAASTKRCPLEACGTAFEPPAPQPERPAPLAFGYLMFTPTSPVLSVSARGADQPQFVAYEGGVQRLGQTLALAWRAHETLGLGAGVAILANSEINTETRSTANANVDFRQDLRVVTAPVAGLSFRPSPRWELGLAYRGELSLKVDTVNNINIQGVDVNLDVESIALFTPRQIALGVSYKPIDELWLMADATWYEWSAFPGAGTAVLPTSGLSAAFLGATIIAEPDFEDIIIPRLGLEWSPVPAWVLRAGGYIRDTPVPRQTGLSNLIDMNKTALGLGLGRRLSDWGEIEVFAQYQHLASEKATKRPPASGGFEADGDIIHLGVGFSMAF